MDAVASIPQRTYMDATKAGGTCHLTPHLSELVFRRVRLVLDRLRDGTLRPAHPGFLPAACRLLTAAVGKRHMPRCLAPP